MSPTTAPVQKAPSVATVTARAQGPTTSSTRAIPQVQPSSFSQAAFRSQPQRQRTVRAATIGPIGPFNRMESAIPTQNKVLVPRPATAWPRLAA